MKLQLDSKAAGVFIKQAHKGARLMAKRMRKAGFLKAKEYRRIRKDLRQAKKEKGPVGAKLVHSALDEMVLRMGWVLSAV